LSVTFPFQQDTLIELRLTDNLLGDSLNPIFSTIEFQALANLRLLDLSGNKIKAVEEGILKGCTKLDVSSTSLRALFNYNNL
jgi:Leucine-rich repeat (LRR) protein